MMNEETFGMFELRRLNGTQSEVELPQSNTESTTSVRVIDESFGAFIFLIVGSLACFLLFAFFLREFYFRRYNISFSSGFLLSFLRSSGQTTEDLQRDRVVAEELQRQLNEEERENERMAKRKERRIWYESYIKPYTMTVEAKDLFYAFEIERMSSSEEKIKEISKMKTLKRISTVSSDEDAEEDDDIENGMNNTLRSCEPVLCEKGDEDAHLYLRLPVQNCKGLHRTVDSHCAICFSEYEEGDKVVWSGLEHCRHAFHDECILPWLSKGKKRCPICRHWFVPGARIEDQKKALEERLRREAATAQGFETSDESELSQSEDSGNDNGNSAYSSLGEREEPLARQILEHTNESHHETNTMQSMIANSIETNIRNLPTKEPIHQV